MLELADDPNDELGGGGAREGEGGDLLGFDFLAEEQADDAVRELEGLAGAGRGADGQVIVGGRGTHG